jgi:glycosyltransferase involved in cell wall biosynthesis
MEAIPRESADALSLKVRLRFLPVSKRQYFNLNTFLSRLRLRDPSLVLYINHSTFLRHNRKIRFPTRLFITHFDEDSLISKGDIWRFKEVEKFLVQNSQVKSYLENLGIDKNRIEIVYGAVSGDVFFPSTDMVESKLNQVLIVGDCKPRKNPELIEETIWKNPNLDFVIHGKNWESYTDLGTRPPANLKIFDFDISNHPKLIRESAALLSLAKIEGGPFPILEALASGTPVIATSTGFAQDLLHNDNGVLLPLNPSSGEISDALKRAVDLKKSVSGLDMTNGEFSWEALGRKLYM